MNRQTYGVLITLLGGICWGFSGVCGQFLFARNELNANELVTLRLLISGVVLLMFSVFYYRGRTDFFAPLRSRKNFLAISFFGVCGVMITQLTYFRAIELSNAAVATTISYIAPAFLLIGSCVGQKRMPKGSEILSLFLAVIGVFFIATHGSFSSLVVSNLALFFALLSAVGFVIYTLCNFIIDPKLPLVLVLGYAMMIGGLVLGVFVEIWKFDGVSDFWGVLALLGVVFIGTIFAFVFYLNGVKVVGASRASMLSCIEMVSALFFSVVWVGTKLTWADYIGVVAILGCVLLIRRS